MYVCMYVCMYDEIQVMTSTPLIEGFNLQENTISKIVLTDFALVHILLSSLIH